uniref:Uncharacterized protein n=1 Tax=Knipowitschia caucasica TaxID=637954 RepID=A0AAV2LLI5_KNICA
MLVSYEPPDSEEHRTGLLQVPRTGGVGCLGLVVVVVGWGMGGGGGVWGGGWVVGVGVVWGVGVGVGGGRGVGVGWGGWGGFVGGGCTMVWLNDLYKDKYE